MKVAMWIGWVCFAITATLLVSAVTSENEPFLPLHVGLTIVIAVPLCLATAATRARRPLYLAAAIVSWPVGGLLWSGAPLVWLPAVFYVRAFVRSSDAPRRTVAAAIVVPVLLGLASFMVLLRGTEERCETSGNATTCASFPTGTGSAASAALALLSVGAGWVLAAPRAQPGPERAMAASSVPR